ncbi:MAG: hypothetical protein JRG89_08750 [Deltaproteobacteria bacterium]|nr:hypothetical protein [Deltaproteobacteria bacterium]
MVPGDAADRLARAALGLRAAWYPGTLLIVWLGPHWGYVLFLVLHSLLAALGTLGLMRAHGVAWSAAWASGLLVALSGYFAHEAQHPGLFAILCWLPVWLWTTRVLFQRPTAGRVAVAACCVAMMLFAGTLQVMFGALILYGFYVLGLLLDERTEHGWRPALRALSVVVLAQVLGASLAAVMLIPAIAHLPQTYEFAAMGSVHPFEMLGLFVNSVGGGLGQGLKLDYDGASFYQGSLTLPLALVGLFATRRRFAIALALAVALLASLALGRDGWLHPLLYDWLPGAVGGLRGMGRALGPGAVAIAILAGLGLQRLGEPGDRVRSLLAVLLTVCLTSYAVLIWRAPDSVPTSALGSALVLLVALMVSLLALAPRSFVERTVGDRAPFLDRWAEGLRSGSALRGNLVALIVFDLVAFGALDRVLDANPPPPTTQRDLDAVPELGEIARGSFGHPGARVMLHGFGPLNLPLLEGVDGVGGYNPLVMLRYLDLVNVINSGRVHKRAPINNFVSGAKPQRFASALFDATSTRFVISNRTEHTRDLRLVKRYADSYFGEVGASLYENESALPRAYLAYRTQRAADEIELARLLSRGFDGRRSSVVEAEGPGLNGAAGITPVERRSERPEVQSFDISPDQPAILVVTDTWYPGWRAWVDDVESPVFRVNALFRGVAVPAGARRVEMRFVPSSFRFGAATSLIAAGVTLALALTAAFRARRERAHER